MTQDKPTSCQGEPKPGPKPKARLDNRRLEVFVQPSNFEMVGEKKEPDSILDRGTYSATAQVRDLGTLLLKKANDFLTHRLAGDSFAIAWKY